MSGPRPPAAVLFDVDGTLIDSNGAHADAWTQALREEGVPVDVMLIRSLIGMGGDKLLPAVAGVSELTEFGQRVTRRKKALFKLALPALRPTRGARELVGFLREKGIDLVIATSADDQELNALLVQAGVADLFPKRTSKEDVKDSKPDPDIVQAALRKLAVSHDRAVMVGDTGYDIKAAHGAGIDAIALRCGGYWPDQLFAGAITICDDPAALQIYWTSEWASTIHSPTHS